MIDIMAASQQQMTDGQIVRRVKVNRTRTAQKALNATGCRQYTDKDVVNAMPQVEDDEVEIVFFNLGRHVSDKDLDKEYQLRNLKPVDPYSLAAVNEADSVFADEKPNATYWNNFNDKWCFARFYRWRAKRRVDVHCYYHIWDGSWWFAGFRK